MKIERSTINFGSESGTELPKSAGKHSKGFTLLEIMIVLAIVGLLAAISVPNLIQARTTSHTSDCISNLSKLDAAIQQWALESNSGSGAPVTAADITPYLGRGAGTLQSMICPADNAKTFATSYTILDASTKPVCQIVPNGIGAHAIN